MVKEFPKGKEWLLDNSALRVSLDMTFDVPEEIAEQLELWGLNIFETCEYDPTCRRLKMSASTTLYRKGAYWNETQTPFTVVPLSVPAVCTAG